MTNLEATTPQLKVIKDFFDAFVALDIKNAEPYMSKDFKYQTFPKIPDLPDATKGDYSETYGTMLSLVTKIEYTCHEVIEAPGKVVIHLSGVAHAVDRTDLGYDTLLVFNLIEEDGTTKILDMKDFADPEKRGKLHSWIAGALAKRSS